MTAADFISKWGQANLNERAAAHEHFVDLCRLLEVPTPIQADPEGSTYRFEKAVSKVAGGDGYADVWKRDHFGWEYKGPKKDLERAYLQLLLYREDLDNPPLLIVSDTKRILIHTNFTGTTKRVYTIELEDLRDPEARALLRHAFTNPEALNPKRQREAITEEATEQIGKIALRLRDRGHDPEHVAHFMMQLVFALFAEDVDLLPNRVFSHILDRTGTNPDIAQRYLDELFTAMADGGTAALEEIPFFNGGLFQGGDVLRLEAEELRILHEAAKLDWAEVEPAIFGTLFERSLDPQKRGQLGAHYTSRDDINRVVEPVIIEPLRGRWLEIRSEVESRLERGHIHKVKEIVGTFLNELRQIRVLDPACGSGNFLYVAMQQLKNLEIEVAELAREVGAPAHSASVGPKQFYGLEINVFARELTSMVVWIGYLQWNRAHGISNRQRPILEKLDNIRLHDALLNPDGTEYEWPAAGYIIGNPPFMGSQLLRSELGDQYVDQLRNVFGDRLPGQSDYVCYWFEKARVQIEAGRAQRVGLLATNSIRGGANREVLRRIKETGDIFAAWSDEPWVLEGAAVRVSIVGFDDGREDMKQLNGKPVPEIHSDLTGVISLDAAQRLHENKNRSFQGVKLVGQFRIAEEVAQRWLKLTNPTGVPNSDVIRPYLATRDITKGPLKTWVIDFQQMSLDQAQEYVVPFEHVRRHVKPSRDKVKRKSRRERWWIFGEAMPSLRDAITPLERFIVTPQTSKHRIFGWVDRDVVIDGGLYAFPFEEDFPFGVLHSSLHEMWSLRQGTNVGQGNDPRYTPTTCFETYPFPRPNDAQRTEVAKWARHLTEVRDQLLTANEGQTLTRLYNELDKLRKRPDTMHWAYPLLIAHEKLDEAVAHAYGWDDWPLEDDEILKRLLSLNLERAAEEQRAASEKGAA